MSEMRTTPLREAEKRALFIGFMDGERLATVARQHRVSILVAERALREEIERKTRKR